MKKRYTRFETRTWAELPQTVAFVSLLEDLDEGGDSVFGQAQVGIKFKCGCACSVYPDGFFGKHMCPQHDLNWVLKQLGEPGLFTREEMWPILEMAADPKKERGVFI